MVVDEIAMWGRVIERLIIVGSAAASLGMGWHLFKIGVVSSQKADFSAQAVSFNLKKVGPGVFLLCSALQF